MAWFDRSAGEKKGPDAAPEKTPEAPKSAAPEPAPVAATPEPPKPAPKVAEPPSSTAGLVGYLYKGSRRQRPIEFSRAQRVSTATSTAKFTVRGR
jgi:hypothetical protein